MKNSYITALCFFILGGLCDNLKAQSAFDRKIEAALSNIHCAVPDERTPVTLNAGLVKDGDSLAVILKVAIAPGWHIYEYVPSTLPYIALERILQLPDSVRAEGGWKKTDATASANDPGVLIYENQAVFIQKAVITKKKERGAKAFVHTGLYYQTCNLRQCLPPAEQGFDLEIEH